MRNNDKNFNHCCLCALIFIIAAAFLISWATGAAKADYHEAYVPGVWYECSASEDYPFFTCVEAEDIEPAPWAPERDRLEWACANPPVDHRTGARSAPGIPQACLDLAELDDLPSGLHAGG